MASPVSAVIASDSRACHGTYRDISPRDLSGETTLVAQVWGRFQRLHQDRGAYSFPQTSHFNQSKRSSTKMALQQWNHFSAALWMEFTHLLRHFRRVLTSKKSCEHRNLSVGIGGSSLIKTLWIEDGRTPWRRNGWIIQNSYRAKQGNYWCTKLVPFKWLSLDHLRVKERSLEINKNYLH